MNDITRITHQEIDTLFNGEVSPDLILEILAKPAVIIDDCEVDYEQFAQWWSYALESLIEYEQQTPEWWRAYKANHVWGQNIARTLDDWCFIQDPDEDDEL